MRRAVAGVAVVMAVGGAACVAPVGECGPGGSCPQGQLCSARYNICYQAEAPQVSWASPQVGQTLVGSTATVSGIISFDGQYTAEISIGRPDQWQPLGVSSTGQFSAPLTLPASNGEPQPLRIRTTEPETAGGRVTVSSIYRAVDNVPPSLSFSEPALRPVPTSVRLVASEPMSASATAPAAIPLDGDAPAVPGQWNADRTEVRFEGLAHDATYLVSVLPGGLADRAGNPTPAPYSVTFTTEPAAPPPDATIPIGSLDLTDLEAASDAEGAVSVVLASAQGLVVWGEFDARTGLFRPLSQAVGTGLLGFQAISAPVPDRRWPDGTSRRAAGVMLSRAASGSVVPSLLYEDVYAPDAGRGTFASVNPGGLSYLPGPGRCGQPPAPETLEVAPSTGQMVLREGAQAPVPVSLPAAPAWTLFQSAVSSEWVTYDGGSILRSVRSCAC
ncbi:MAG TPA: Ig-like domain-containing protein, partial [Myxococcales bacterium]|nr:Ig-like domain-containing protein [Myxococcales bacterium]